ncbi:MAG: hypothetical protein FVQ79_03380 [Planctomycetes bacterium]|nr:hypothetical protein [Planctomycetota bacterium]
MDQSFPNIDDGRKVVAAAGTAERLVAAITSARKVTIMAELDNTDYVVVGGANVVAALATRRGIALSPGTSIILYVEDLYTIYVDAVVSSEGVTFIYQF